MHECHCYHMHVLIGHLANNVSQTMMQRPDLCNLAYLLPDVRQGNCSPHIRKVSLSTLKGGKIQ